MRQVELWVSPPKAAAARDVQRSLMKLAKRIDDGYSIHAAFGRKRPYAMT